MTSDSNALAPDRPGEDRAKPRIWVLLGHRLGDNLQLEALADALGWPWQAKFLAWQKPLPRWGFFYARSASLKHLAPKAQAGFAPPWPDIVLAVGWRSVPVARWIKQQSGARLVHLGRPRAPLDLFDLVLTTPQYRMPDAQNLLQLSGPVTALSGERLAIAAAQWQPRLDHLPRPWTAVLIGGNAPPLHLPTKAAADLAEASNQLARSQNGSLLVATGPRTPPQSAKAFLDTVAVPAFCYEWRKGSDNPYAAFLALADGFIVTSDSISMAHEAAQTGRPLHIFALPLSMGWLHKTLRRIDQKLRENGSIFSRAYLRLIHAGLAYPPRSTADYFDALIREGRAVKLGDPATKPPKHEDQTDLERATAAIHALFQQPQISDTDSNAKGRPSPDS